jgi:hypothetical protein
MERNSPEYVAAQSERNKEFLDKFIALLREYKAEFEHDVEYRGYEAFGSVATVTGDAECDSNGNIISPGIDIKLNRYVSSWPI